jgi:hypothetical protein
LRERFLGDDVRRHTTEFTNQDAEWPRGETVQQDLLVVVLGGECRGYRAANFYPEEVEYSDVEASEAECDQVQLPTDAGAPLWGRCGLFRTAAFLTLVDRVRVAELDNLVMANPGEFTEEGRDPEGQD